MAAGRVLELKFIADVANLQKGFAQAGKSGDKFGKTVSGRVGLGLNKLKLGAIGAGLALGTGLVKGLQGSVEAALEAEESQARVDAALKKVGATSQAFKGRVDSAITSLSQMSGFDDEELANAFADMTRTTGDAQGSLKNMSVVADLARAKNISLGAAAKIVGRVQNGNTGILKRYGIELKKGATAQDALAAMQKKFGGAAKAYGETTKGSIDRAKVAFGNLQESVGQHLLPAIAAGATKLAELLNRYGPIVAEKLGVAIDWVKQHWPQIRATIAEVMAALEPIIRPILDNVKQIFALVGAALNGDWDQVWQRVKNIVSNSLTAIWNYLKLVYPRIGAAAKALGEVAWRKIKEGVSKLPGIAQTALAALWQKVKDYAPKIGGAALDIGSRLLNRIAEKAAELPGKVGEWVSKIPAKLRDYLDEIGGAASEIGSKIWSSITGALGNLGSWIEGKVRAAVNWMIGTFNSSMSSAASRVNSALAFSIGIPGFDVGPVHVAGRSISIDPPDVSFPSIPLLGDGGVVRARRGGTLTRIGEAGDDEAVVPLPRGLRAGIGGTTIVVHQHIAGSVVTEQQLFSRWVDHVERQARRDRAILPAGSVRAR